MGTNTFLLSVPLPVKISDCNPQASKHLVDNRRLKYGTVIKQTKRKDQAIGKLGSLSKTFTLYFPFNI